ncbi:MAG TPA: NAD(P)H-binding protein [Methylibium sp.]|uniref:NAD(P)H-binding protein n=1 Tax=Methylibium sp. TaxID=2067992 RepID=UPI002DB956BC|nr:NAD(P)H-binding protein [Methylibium sp.]HEU4459840.1 NAD(P)H-binding protein [Methylibium sp.]
MAHSAAARVLIFGATGTIGQATAQALRRSGREVVAVVRAPPAGRAAAVHGQALRRLAGVELRVADVTDPSSLLRDGLRGERFDAVVSCLASRTGAPRDAWAIDHGAQLNVLRAAQAAGAAQFVLLSAICVQKPRLAFQHAKLAFEKTLVESGIGHSIVRPTAYFKSLSGQVDRLRRGRPFLVFGDGRLTACKPIADEDLADYLAGCLDDPARRNRILPIGGPGEAVTPREQGERLFELLGMRPRFREVPLALLDGVIGALALAGRIAPSLAGKAELARIGRYYASESMLVWDAQAGRYDAAATPSTGTRTLFDFYAALLKGDAAAPERGDHAVF